MRGIHRSPVNSPHKGQCRGALKFSLICVWMNDWVNHREADVLRRYRAHYVVTPMELCAYLLACITGFLFTQKILSYWYWDFHLWNRLKFTIFFTRKTVCFSEQRPWSAHAEQICEIKFKVLYKTITQQESVIWGCYHDTCTCWC